MVEGFLMAIMIGPQRPIDVASIDRHLLPYSSSGFPAHDGSDWHSDR